MSIRRTFLMATAITAGLTVSASAEDCPADVQHFNEAVDAGQIAEAQRIIDAISTDGLCGRFQVQVQRRLAAVRLSNVQEMMARGRPSAEYDAMLKEAAKPGVLWQAAATVGDVRFGERRFDEAARAFDTAIDLIRNESVTSAPPSKLDVQELIDRAAQARLLEANQGSGHRPPSYVAASSDKQDGKLGGFFAPAVRGIVPHALPLPIVFDYDKATLTPIGEDAARELLRAVEEQQPDKIKLVGHTDIRGGAEYNVKLSRERAEAVAAFMRRNGVNVPIETAGVGSSEPMQIEDTAGLTQDDIYALNRRVDFARE